MKRATIYAIIIAACALMAGCATDGEEITSATTKLSVSVSDNGFANANGTRTSENDYATTFTDGDEIGVFAVVGEKVSDAAKNVKMTYDGTSKSWTGELYDIAGATYYAYYPYQSELTGDLVPSATTADGFFTNVISSWTVKLDQSQYANYTASDLMVAKGSVSSGKLSFSMAHMMTLVVMNPTKITYKYTTSSNAAEEFSQPTPMTWLLPEGFAPYVMNNQYRYIYNGKFTVSGMYGKRKFKQELAFASGTIKLLTIDDATATNKEIKVGDYYMKDGTIRSTSDNNLTEGEKADIIGYVFSLGHNANDKSDYSSTGIGQKQCHGYVIRTGFVNTVNTSYWTSAATGLNNTDIEGIDNETTSNCTSWSGYKNTQAIRVLTENNSSATTRGCAAKMAYSVSGAPSTSSGWFLPSGAQAMEAKKVSLPSSTIWDKDIWTSSEVNTWQAIYSKSGTLSSENKNSNPGWVLPALAF